jgi:hypothetical protein
MNAKKFIKIYEREIKEHRDSYYKNIILNNNKTMHTYPVLTFLIPLLVASLILVLSEFTILSYIISITILILLNLFIYFIFTSRIEKNEYLEAIKRYGYRSIEDYEMKLKKYISGPNGYYNTLLLDLIEKYNINSSTKKIKMINNEEYYIWSNKNKDKIYLLNTQIIHKPEPIIIQVSNIRYFRVDITNQNVILKTNNDIFTFKPETVTLFNEMIKNKRLENLKTFEPGTYINDYEIFMHKVKKNMQKDYTTKKEKFDASLHNTIYLLIAITIIIVLTYIFEDISNITNIINCFLIILLNYSINGILNNIVKEHIKADIDTIRELNTNPEYIQVFNELKYVLGINENYDKVYTTEGAEYITWTANGYFHVFLNLIYFNSVYMAVKTSDVKYYKVDNNSCDIKLKDKTLEFTKESQQVFSKLLPNKDYDWIKTYQKR